MTNNRNSIRRSLLSSQSTSSCCRVCIVIILCQYFCCIIVICGIFFYGHYISCRYSDSLCTQLPFYLKKIALEPDPIVITQDKNINSNSDEISLESQIWRDANNLTCHVSRKRLWNENVDKINVKKLILFASPRSGSTWLDSQLNTHDRIFMKGEVLYGISTNECSYVSKYIDKNSYSLCKWSLIERKLSRSYNDIYDKYKKEIGANKGDNRVFYIGFKVNNPQIPVGMIGKFIQYTYCNNIVIIHLIRSATILSFYNYQSESVDFIENFKHELSIGTNDKSFNYIYSHRDEAQYSMHHNTDRNGDDILSLDGYLASKFVAKREYWYQFYARLWRYHKESVMYLQVYYEDLVGNFANNYLLMIQSFLNISHSDMFTTTNDKKNKNRVHKLHNLPCYQRIANWDDIKTNYLKDTNTYYACQKQKS